VSAAPEGSAAVPSGPAGGVQSMSASHARKRPARNGIVVGFAAKSSIPAARARSGSPCMTLAVSAMIGTRAAPLRASSARIARAS
jgi:hypothetical protein